MFLRIAWQDILARQEARGPDSIGEVLTDLVDLEEEPPCKRRKTAPAPVEEKDSFRASAHFLRVIALVSSRVV